MDISQIILMAAIMLVAILLILIVLIQNAKGGGIASNVGVSNQMFGARKETEIVEKRTWQLMGLLAVLCIVSGFFFQYQAPVAQQMGKELPVENLDMSQTGMGQQPIVPNP